MILQLNPPLPIYCVSRNKSGMAYFLTDYSQEHDNYWMIALDGDDELWTVSNKDIRLQRNITMRRDPLTEDIKYCNVAPIL